MTHHVMVWGDSKSGKFKVIDGNVMIISDQHWEGADLPLNLCWNKVNLPKVGPFLWHHEKNLAWFDHSSSIWEWGNRTKQKRGECKWGSSPYGGLN